MGSVRTDKFGNPTMLVGCKPNKKNDAFNKGYAELGGKLYKIEVSEATKEGYAYWVKITKVKKSTQQDRSM